MKISRSELEAEFGGDRTVLWIIMLGMIIGYFVPIVQILAYGACVVLVLKGRREWILKLGTAFFVVVALGALLR